MSATQQRDVICALNDAVFRVTRPVSDELWPPSLCDDCLAKAAATEQIRERPAGYVVDDRRPLSRMQAADLRGRWRGRLGSIRVTEGARRG